MSFLSGASVADIWPEVTIKWLCHTCLVETDEPFCSICGLDLSHENNNSPGLHPLDGSAGRGMEVES